MSAAAPTPADVSALILAAGSGERLGEPKAFLAANGWTLLERAVAAVTPVAAEVIVGVPEADLVRARELVGGAAKVIGGGETRQQTIEILLAESTRRFILLHEAARPFTTPDLFIRVLAAAVEFGAACPCVPASCRDALATVDGDFFDKPLPLDSTVKTQTPQAYRRDILTDVFAKARNNGWSTQSVVPLCVEAGYPVRMIPGEDDNLKITFSEDWEAFCDRIGNRER